MSAAEPWSSSLACRFMAELLERTIGIMDDHAHQQAVQAFVDELRPWIPPTNGPARSHATLFDSLELDEQTGMVSVAFTPEGLACFHGWLRRQGLDLAMSTS
jgi:hypothetical protein